MEHVSVISAFKFGFKTFFKNILFFIGASIVTIFAWIAGAILSLLLALPFFIPLWAGFSKIKEVITEIFGQLGALKTEMAQEGASAATVAAENADKFRGVFAKISTAILNLFKNFPHIVIFGILGVIIFFFLLWLIQMVISLGWCKIALDFKDKGTSTISMIFAPFGRALKAAWIVILALFVITLPWMASAYFATLSETLGVLVGLCAFGFTIYFLLKIAYSFWFIVDKQIGATAAIKHSFNLVGGPSRIFLFTLLLLPVGLGAGLVVGLLLSTLRLAILMPLVSAFLQFALATISLLGVAYLYRELERRQ